MKRCPIVFLTTLLLLTGAGHAASSEEDASGASKPFVLIARLHALPGQSSKVIALSDAADKAVKASEPGMLLHTFDRDPNDALGFVWTEVYANSQALEFHLQNPDLIKYLEEVGPFLDVFTVELYGSVSDPAVNMLKATGTPTKHYKTELGYIRDFKQ